MKKIADLGARVKIMALSLTTLAFVTGTSQTDTLHLNYHFTQTLPHDSTIAKIDKWAKKLKGQHVDIKVIAYYHKMEFRKFAQERCDELFLVLNRKARELITIELIGPKKGEDYQRTMVDIIYKPTFDPVADKAKKDAAKMEEEKKKEAEKVVAAKLKAEKDAEKAKEAEEKKKAKAIEDEKKAAEDKVKEAEKAEKNAKEEEAKKLKEAEKKEKEGTKKEDSKGAGGDAKDAEKAKEKAEKKEKEDKEKAEKKEKEAEAKKAKDKEKQEKEAAKKDKK